MSNFYGHFAAAAERFADRPAVESVGADRHTALTYAELTASVSRVAAWLAQQRIGRGERIALLGSNDADWVATYLAAMRHGAVVVPLDTAYTAAQVRTVLLDSGACLLFTTERLLATARQAADDGALVRIERLGAQDGVSSATSADEPAPVGASDPAVILYTSGTTADPKGVVLTHANLAAERQAVLAVVKADERDVVLGVLPLFHALAEMANLWLPLTIGARVVFLETVSSTTLLDALQTRAVTILACVPQFFYLIHQRVAGEINGRGAIVRMLLRAIITVNVWTRDRIGLNVGTRLFARVHHALGPKMRLLITGGSRFDPAIARDLYGLGVTVYNGYGLTETSGAASIVRFGDRFTTSVGPPVPGVEIRIAAERAVERRKASGVPADPKEDGEILIRGPIVMPGYWNRPDATAEAIKDGWLHTGDLGRIDSDGRLHITGRSKDVIVLSSGKNIYPEEIEAHYKQTPFIKELCVMGLSRPGEPAAERLHAVIVPNDVVMRERGIVNIGDRIRFELEGLSVQLPAHKRILSYDVSADALPRTTTGKLKRGEIERQARERAATPAKRQPESAGDAIWLAEGDRTEVLQAIAERLRIDRVSPDANLELDLSLDSMERVELLSTLEARRGTRVPEETRATLFTVRQLVEAVERATPGGAGSAGAVDDQLPWDALLAEPADPRLEHELQRSKWLRAFAIWLILQFALVISRVLLGLRVSGRANLPVSGPVIVSPNHQTFLDGFLVAAALPFHAFRRIFFVGAAELFESPLMAWGARAINILSIDPDANLVRAMQAAATGLRLGKVLILFPEGERSIDGSLKPFRKGAAILASHQHAPIVPVGLDGLFPVWPRGRPFQWTALVPTRTRSAIVFGRPLTVTRGQYVEGTAALRQAVTNLIASMRR